MMMYQTTNLRRARVTLPRAGEEGPHGGLLREIIAVEEVCPPGSIYQSGPFPHLILYQSCAGSAVVETGVGLQERHTIDRLLVAGANLRLTERVDTAHFWHCRYLLLAGVWADQMSERLHRTGATLLPLATLDMRECTYFDDLFEMTFRQNDGWQWRFVGLLGLLYEPLWISARTLPHSALVDQIAALCDATPAARPTPAEVAHHVGMSPRQLLYEFSKAAGEPLGGWMRNRRVALARRLLEQGKSVVTVAAMLGYANPSHFSRQFKDVTGVCPSSVIGQTRQVGLHLL